MTHFSPEEFVDAAEGALDSARMRHLDQCERCRSELAVLAALLRDAQRAPVPEPSPLFWDHLSARVGEAVRAEGRPASTIWLGWPRWAALMPLAGLAVVVAAIVSTVPRTIAVVETPGGAAPPPRSASVVEPDDTASGHAAWSALAEIVGPLDWDTADAAGLTVNPGDVERAALELDDEERLELTRLIAGELARAKS